MLTSPAFLVPVALALVVVLVGAGVLLTRGEDVDLAGDHRQTTLVAAMADPAADGGGATPMADGMADAMVEAMTDPDPGTAQTQATRPEPLGPMPDAPPEPPAFVSEDNPIPEQMTDPAGDPVVGAIRAAAVPVEPLEPVTIEIGGDDAAAISFTLQPGELISVSAVGDQDPEVVIFGPDDAPIAADDDSGPGNNALATTVATTGGQYVAAAVHGTGQSGTLTMTLQDFGEFQIFDVPDGDAQPGELTTFGVEAVAGEVLYVLVHSSAFTPIVGIGRGQELLATGTDLGGGLHLVEWAVQADGTHDVLVTAEQVGGSFVLYATIQVR